MSDKKWFLPEYLDMLTAVAAAKAPYFIQGSPLYSYAITVATDQTVEACPDGKESPWSQNSALPSSIFGLGRWEASFKTRVTMPVSISASPARMPVSRAFALCVNRPAR